jgi:lambda family phage tail tape measure protein
MDIASLGIKVDSSDVATASTDLDRLTTAGIKAEESAKRSGSAWSKSLSAMAGDTQQIVRELQALNAKQDATAKLMVTVGTAVTGAATSFSSAAVSISSYQAKLDALASANQKSSDSTRRSSEETRKQADSLSALLGRIDPTVAALGRLDELEKKLGQQKRLGALDAETFAQYQAKIDQSRAALGRFDDSLTRTGNTARQNAAALRGVPAQFTDIVTSIQGGQAPLTVLLQQGGQLKDMFGGIGPAAKALGGYILGLVNPYTVAAAAAAALGLAYYKGSQESAEFRKAVVLTGNAAGTSAPQLAEMSRQISATVGTTGAAAEVLTQLAASGKIASGSFIEIGKAALAMEQATGKAVADTVAEFVEIGKDPVGAAKKLQDQYRFLTQSVYEQIVALKEQGDTIGAAKLLTDAYSEAIQSRTGEITQNLGLIQSAWKGIKSAAKEALDATLEVGRSQSIDAQIAAKQAVLDSRKTSIAASIFSGTLGPDSDSTRFIQNQIDALKKEKVQIEENAKADKARRDQNAAVVDATDRILAANKANESVEKRRNRLIKEYLRDIETIRGKNSGSALVTAEAVAKGVQEIKDKNKDPAKPKGPTPSVDLTAFNNTKLAMAALVDDYKNSQKELEAEQKAGIISQADYFARRTVLISAEKEQVTAAYQAEIDALQAAKAKSSTTANQSLALDQKIATARADMLQAQKDADSQQRVLAANETSRLQKQTVASQAYVEQLERQRAALAASGSRAASALGLGDRQQGLQNSLDSTTDRFNDERAKLLDRRKTAPDKYSNEDYLKDLSSLQAAENSYRDTVLANYDKMTAAQSDWRKGATSAYQTYLESAQNVAGQTKNLFSNAFSSMEDAVVNFAVTGKASFSDFTKSVIADMARIAARQASTSLLSTGVSALGGLFSGGVTSAGSTAAGYTGAAYQSYLTGTRATGGSVAPSSLYQVNENGPELYNQGGKSYLMTGANGGSVTPLTSGSTAAMGSGSGSGSIQVSIAIASDGSTDVSSNQSGLQQFGAEVGKLVEQKYKELEARSLGAQGNIRKAINGRA